LWLVTFVVDGFAAYGEANCPGLLKTESMVTERESRQARADLNHGQAMKQPAWRGRRAERVSMSSPLEAIDDRTLEDIGLQRWQVGGPLPRRGPWVW
jgi:uncharacterized protein YjiS (DUF1127 family)